MPRKIPWPPKIIPRDGNDYIRIHLSPGHRVDRLLGPTGSEQARVEYLRIVAELEAGKRLQGGPQTKVSDIALEFWNAMKNEIDARDLSHIKSALNPLIKLYAHTLVVNFGPVALRTVREEYVKQGFCRFTCNRYAGIIRRLFRWGAAHELCSADIALRLKTMEPLRKGKTRAPETPDIRPAKDEDVEKTLPHLPPIVADMVRLQRLTGMRPGEVCALCPADIDREWKTVDGVKLWLARYDEHKCDWRDQKRWIPLGPKAQELLLPYLDREPDKPCFSPKEVYVGWCTANNRKPKLKRRSRLPRDCYDTSVYDRTVSRACKRAGVKWTPNQLRHTAGTLVETEYSREDARCFLGHANPTTTAIYAEQTDRAARIAAKLG